MTQMIHAWQGLGCRHRLCHHRSPGKKQNHGALAHRCPVPAVVVVPGVLVAALAALLGAVSGAAGRMSWTGKACGRSTWLKTSASVVGSQMKTASGEVCGHPQHLMPQPPPSLWQRTMMMVSHRLVVKLVGRCEALSVAVACAVVTPLARWPSDWWGRRPGERKCRHAHKTKTHTWRAMGIGSTYRYSSRVIATHHRVGVFECRKQVEIGGFRALDAVLTVLRRIAKGHTGTTIPETANCMSAPSATQQR